MNVRRFASLCAAALIALIIAPPALWACQIPVFRYALERWEPDVYEALVIHRGDLKAAEQALLDRLQKAAADEQQPLNLETRVVDIDRLSDEQSKELFGEAGPPQELPWVVLQYPRGAYTARHAWTGPLTEENVNGLLDSPTRREIAKRILAGDSAVWVLIESGDKAQDKKAAETLGTQLAVNQKELKLPPQEELQQDEFFQSETAVELKLAFSLLRVRRDDPAEAIFVSTLINSEKDLHTLKEPIAIPVFGRGRSYFAMVGKGINEENLAEDCQFLTGPCSCRVKQENPGVDLLFAVNWWEKITDSVIVDKPLPELSGIAGLIPAAADGDADSAAEQPETQETPTISNGPTAPPQDADINDAPTESKNDKPATQPSPDAPKELALADAPAPVTPATQTVPAPVVVRPDVAVWIPFAAIIGMGIVVLGIGTYMIMTKGAK